MMVVWGNRRCYHRTQGKTGARSTLTLRGKWCLNWGLEEQSSWLSHRDSIPRRESICPGPEVRWQPPYFGSRHVCLCAHGHTHVWVWVKYYIRICWVNGYEERGKEGQNPGQLLSLCWKDNQVVPFTEQAHREEKVWHGELCALFWKCGICGPVSLCMKTLWHTVWSSEKDLSSRSGTQSFQHMDDTRSQGSK